MSESTLSPMTAPRDRGELMKISPFKLRFLVQELGGLNDDGQKMAWHGMKTREQQVEYAFALLQNWDQQNPGKAQAPAPQQQPQQQQAAPQQHVNGATPHQPMSAPQGYQNPYPVAPMQAPGPMQQPMLTTAPMAPPPGMVAPGMAPMPGQPMMAPQMAAVSQGATQAAQEATTGKPKRQPRTTGEAAAGGAVDFGMEVVNLLTGISGKLEAQTSGLADLKQSIIGALEEAAGSKTSRVSALEAKYAELTDTLRQHNGYLQSISQLQVWQIMMNLTFMQENMQLPPVQVLQAAIQDSAMFQKLVDQATGKV